MHKPTPIGELDEYIQAWQRLIASPDHVTEVEDMQRTGQQNKALHLWLTQLADELNASGQSLGDGKLIRVPVAFTGDNLKEHVLKPYMNALHPDYDSTTQLSTAELINLCDNLGLIIAERSGVSVPFPSEESLSEEQR